MDLIFSDLDSFTGSSDSEDQDSTEFMYEGQACSILSNLEESLGKIDDLLLFERGFIHGDIVRSAKEPNGQMGKVINVDITAELENINGIKIQTLNSKHLKRIRSLSVGDYVVHGAWLGKIEKIVDSLTLLFPDGTKSEFTMSDSEKLVPIYPDLLEEDPQYPFYPGQTVEVKCMSVSNSASWFFDGVRNNKGKKQATVCSVEAGVVLVCWLGCALVGSHEKLSVPSCLQDSKNLSLLSCFPHENWEVGDWCLLHGMEKTEKKHLKQNLAPDIAVIAKKKTKVDVLWQDGSSSMGLDPKLLISVNFIDPHDFCPGQIVIQKEMCDDDDDDDDSPPKSIHKYGVVKSVNALDRIVKVEWRKDHSIEIGSHQTEEIYSVYELTEHPDYSYGIGDAVFRLHLNNNLLPFIGIVAGLKDGYVEVKWTSGIIEKVAPYEICGVVKFENPSSVMPITASVEVPNENIQKKFYRSSSCSLPQAATGLFTHIRGFLYDSFRTYLLGGYNHLSDDGVEIQSETVPENHKTTMDVNVGEIVDEVEDERDHHDPHGKMLDEHFRQFDMVNDCSDHHFARGTGNRLESSQIKQSLLKKVQQEWSILKSHLPETIYVRVYEERIDLLRAAIVGPQGTPYQDLLFFFDLFLPPEYPNEPPMVYYNSGGLRINPNLYESGRVCLSLLNTWAGSESEVWNPKSSTILQVVLSLQALVLNEKPYFNEAGYGLQIGTAEAEKNSICYNENAFLVSCRSLLYLIRTPPKHFEELVKEHINRRGKDILLACEAYMEGSPVGCAFKAKEESKTGSSMGFKIMVGKLFPKLVEAFSAMGTDCSQISSFP